MCVYEPYNNGPPVLYKSVEMRGQQLGHFHFGYFRPNYRPNYPAYLLILTSLRYCRQPLLTFGPSFTTHCPAHIYTYSYIYIWYGTVHGQADCLAIFRRRLLW